MSPSSLFFFPSFCYFLPLNKLCDGIPGMVTVEITDAGVDDRSILHCSVGIPKIPPWQMLNSL